MDLYRFLDYISSSLDVFTSVFLFEMSCNQRISDMFCFKESYKNKATESGTRLHHNKRSKCDILVD